MPESETDELRARIAGRFQEDLAERFEAEALKVLDAIDELPKRNEEPPRDAMAALHGKLGFIRAVLNG